MACWGRILQERRGCRWKKTDQQLKWADRHVDVFPHFGMWFGNAMM